jgi:hypothetical protein
MQPSLVFLVALAGEILHVLAGSRVWQPSVRSNSAGHLDRRYFVINTDPGEGERIIWPNRQIRYCFDSDESRTALNDLLIAAHDVWLRKGLGSEFTIVEVGHDECTGDHRFDTLLIDWSGDSGPMATFEGLMATDSILRTSQDPNVRPRMTLTTSTSMGMLDQVANFAHELGHAWGLYHEHQNPAFWGRGSYPNMISNALGGTVFGPGNWRCENLKDYQSRVAGGGLVVQNPNNRNQGNRIGVDAMCRDWDYAHKAQFSARDYLPMPQKMGIATSNGKDENDVDWESIMICWLPALQDTIAGLNVTADRPRPLRSWCHW